VAALGIVRPGLFAPELRAGVSYAKSGSITVAGNDSASFAWWRGELEACPLRFVLASTLYERPCAFVRAGAILASGNGQRSSLSPTEPWGELGVSALLEWDIVGPLRLEAEVGLSFPLSRQSFEFSNPEADVYTPPWAMPEARIGLAVRFP
jgi:hypothetical protein